MQGVIRPFQLILKNLHAGLAPGKIVIGRLGAPFRHQLVAALFTNGHGHFRIRIMHVTKQARAGGTGQHAGWFALNLRQGVIGNTVDTKGAFFHHLLVFVQLAHAIGTGPGAVFAANAFVVVHQHHAIVLALVGSSGRAYRHTGRLFTMQATLGEMHGFGLWKFTYLKSLHPVEKGSRGILVIGAVIREGAGPPGGVPFLAGSNTGMTAHTHV